MHYPLAVAVVAASLPIILVLCRAVGPGRAAPYAILGTLLILARTNPDDKLFGILTIDKQTIAGLSLVLGVLLFDRGTLSRARLRWIDAPMLLYVVAPVVNILVGKSIDIWGSFDQSWLTFATWGVPYAMGRLYFGDRDGPRRLSIAVVVAGLISIPFCVYEMVMGKGWFLRSLIYGLTTDGEYRLGGWRPVMMMSHGLELVAWMALASITSVWLWTSGERWRKPYLAAWVPPIALLTTTIACRGLYGYLTLTVGLTMIGLLLLTRSKWALGPLLLIPWIYLGFRVTGIWDARGFARLAEHFGSREGSSVGLRLMMEDQFIRQSIDHGIVFGMGGRYADSWADGWWLTLLKRGGLFAVTCHYAAFLLPPALFLVRRSSRPVVASSAAGLALFILLQSLDSLQNTSLIPVSTLLGGSLAGLFLVKPGRQSRGHPPGSRSSTTGETGHTTYRVGDLGDLTLQPTRTSPTKTVDVFAQAGFLLATACLLYVFDHAKVDGQQGAKLVGGFGSDFLFATAGALAAASARRSLLRVTAFGLAFALLATTSNLANHPSFRPLWMANVLQGMVLSGVVVAGWRRLTGGRTLAYAGLAILGLGWWSLRDDAPVFPGSQYLYAAGDPILALFPVVPWLTLAALGAVLVGSPMIVRASLSLCLGLAAVLIWSDGPLFGQPTKFPMNPTHALIGGSLISAVFWLSGMALRWRPMALGSAWLGSRWLVFFYVHLSFMTFLSKVGLRQPIACWTAMLALSIPVTWLVSAVFERVRRPFRQPWIWAVMAALTFVAGLSPGVPYLVVYVVGVGFGLAFASRYDDLADLMLGPVLAEPRTPSASRSRADWPGSLARLALVAAILTAPEIIARLPWPFGTSVRSKLPAPVVPQADDDDVVASPDRETEPGP